MEVRIIIPLLALAALAKSNDISVGLTGTKVFDEIKEASPALWRQDQNITISANDSEVISRVVVTDLRPDKNGEAEIVEGGEGHKNVTIELKSPAVLRGYSFQIEVYVMPDDHNDSHRVNDNHQHQPRKGKHPEYENRKVQIEPNFGQPRTNLEGNKAPEHQPTPVDSVDGSNNAKDNTFKPNASSFQAIGATFKPQKDEHNSEKGKEHFHELQNLTNSGLPPSVLNSGETLKYHEDQNTTRSDKKLTNKDEKPSNRALPPSVLNNDKENTFNIPVMTDRDLTTKGEHTRHVRDTHSEANNGNDPRIHLQVVPIVASSTDATPKVDSTTKNIKDKLHEHDTNEKIKPSFVPLNVAKSVDTFTPEPVAKDNNTSTNTAKTNLDSKASTNEKPRNARDTHNENVDLATKVPITGQEGFKSTATTPKTIQGKLTQVPQDHFQPYPGLKLSSSTGAPSTTTTSGHEKSTTSAETDEDFHEYNVKAIPKMLDTEKNAKVKPVISIQ